MFHELSNISELNMITLLIIWLLFWSMYYGWYTNGNSILSIIDYGLWMIIPLISVVLTVIDYWSLKTMDGCTDNICSANNNQECYLINRGYIRLIHGPVGNSRILKWRLLYHIRSYFWGISTYIGLVYGRHLQLLSVPVAWPLIWVKKNL